jgi:alkanesulfonate monooxygenase SsuD/methylene tetrahydromethanopterin reductase-like flavin-dependent oxidoreductase (luciferase family)
VELGLGVGWLEEEFVALGVPWERRGARNDEYVEAMRALWAGPHAEYHGEFVDFAPVTCSPRPVQQSIPILVGGDTPVALRRAVRYADGYFPGEGDIDQLRRLLAALRTTSEQHGRDPDSIEINAMYGSLGHDIAGRVEELADAGVSRVMVPAFGFGGPEGIDRFESFGRIAVGAAARIAP